MRPSVQNFELGEIVQKVHLLARPVTQRNCGMIGVCCVLIPREDVVISPEEGVWKPGSKKLTWGRATLKSSISAGYPGGHILLDHIVRAAMPWVDPKLENHLSNEESLLYENVGMRINKGSDKVDLLYVHSNQTAQIDKDVFLKLIDDLRKDFCETSKSGSGEEVNSSKSKSLPNGRNPSLKIKSMFAHTFPMSGLYADEDLPVTPTRVFPPVAVCSEEGVWKPENKKLRWDRATLKSSISAGYPGGHMLLDHIVRAAMPWVDPKLENHLSNGESLFYENVGMRINKGSNKVDLVSVHSKQTAQIDKDVFLKLIDDLRKDFHEASKSGNGEEVNSSKSKSLPNGGIHSLKRKGRQHKLGDAKGREEAIKRKSPRLNNTDANGW